MNYFDLHCDTISRAFDDKLSLYDDKLQVSLKNTDAFEKYTQCHALFVNDRFRLDASEKRANELYEFYMAQMPQFNKHKSLTSFLTLENCECFNNKTESVCLWRSRGVRAATLTWNGENSLGFGSGMLSGGLKAFGIKVIHAMENERMVVDVSHLNEDGFCDVCFKAKRPFIASHSNCFSLCPHSRNLKDYQIKEIISCGGLIGLCFYQPFLGSGNIYKRLFEQIKHILHLGGENSIALGSDFDGAKMNFRLNKICKVSNLYFYLAKKGIEKELLEKIFFKNAENFFNNVLQD